MRALREQDGKAFQPVMVTLRHFGEEADAVIRVRRASALNHGRMPMPRRSLKSGLQEMELMVPMPSRAETKRQVTVEVAGKTVASREVTLKPVKKLTVYILPHSHTDIGYTEIQTAIEKKQVQQPGRRHGGGQAHGRLSRRVRASSGTSRCSGRRTCTCIGSTISSGRSSSTRSRRARSS